MVVALAGSLSDTLPQLDPVEAVHINAMLPQHI